MNISQPQFALLACLLGFLGLTHAQENETLPIDLIELLGELSEDDQQVMEEILSKISQPNNQQGKLKENAGESNE